LRCPGSVDRASYQNHCGLIGLTGQRSGGSDLPVLDRAGTVATCPPSLTEKLVDRLRRAQRRLLSKSG